MMAMPADAPERRTNAYAFINYLLEPEVMAKISELRHLPERRPGLLRPDRRGGEGRSRTCSRPRRCSQNLFMVTPYDQRVQRDGDPPVDQHRHRQLTGEPDLGPQRARPMFEKEIDVEEISPHRPRDRAWASVCRARRQDKVVKIYNWSDYIDPQVLDGLHRQDRHPGGLRPVRQQRGARDQAARRQHRLRPRGADRLLPRPPDPGRDLPAAGQVQDPELEEPRPRADGQGRQVRSGQRARR